METSELGVRRGVSSCVAYLGRLESPRPGLPHELGDGADGTMCHMGADGDPSVAAVPKGELSGEVIALERSGTMDHRAVDGGVKAVTHSDNIVDEATVCDSSPAPCNAAEPEKATDNTAAARTGRRLGLGDGR
ncbi:hypothetical protein PIB30_064888 [Stylosanthes scabra]|uniref:Uncharacterized protein n=1 Tax=Stylosanthes scabra TaxID=79078 RepID=A0ABU6VQ52_9FABA|nr:hypothetical protein [Stylosanthes scabra]